MHLASTCRAILALTLAGCSAPAPRIGVEVFSEDTVPVLFTLAQTGTLQLAVNAAELFVQPDKTVIFKTPATLVIQKGQGSSLISSRPRHGRMAVQPIEISPDSAERAAIVGTAVKLTRLGTESRVRLEVERP